MPSAADIKHMKKLDLGQVSKDLYRDLEMIEQELKKSEINPDYILKKIRKNKPSMRAIINELN